LPAKNRGKEVEVVMKSKAGILAFVFVTVLGIGDVFGALVLPESQYADGQWQGTSYYEEDGFDVRIDFAVYDVQEHPEDFEWVAEPAMPGTDRYIYAYQVFNHPTAEEDIAYFKVLDINRNEIDEALMHSTTSQNDESGGVEPLDSTTQGVWEFEWGILIADTHSYFLIFSSNNAPTAGDYEISSFEPEGEFAVPTPEPATIVLLGLSATTMLLRSRRRKQKLSM